MCDNDDCRDGYCAGAACDCGCHADEEEEQQFYEEQQRQDDEDDDTADDDDGPGY